MPTYNIRFFFVCLSVFVACLFSFLFVFASRFLFISLTEIVAKEQETDGKVVHRG